MVWLKVGLAGCVGICVVCELGLGSFCEKRGGGGFAHPPLTHSLQDIFKQNFRRESFACISRSWMLCSEMAGDGGGGAKVCMWVLDLISATSKGKKKKHE